MGRGPRDDSVQRLSSGAAGPPRRRCLLLSRPPRAGRARDHAGNQNPNPTLTLTQTPIRTLTLTLTLTMQRAAARKGLGKASLSYKGGQSRPWCRWEAVYSTHALKLLLKGAAVGEESKVASVCALLAKRVIKPPLNSAAVSRRVGAGHRLQLGHSVRRGGVSDCSL